MLPKYFDYIFVHLRQKLRLRPKLSPKFLSTVGPNPNRKAQRDLQLCSVDHPKKGTILKLPQEKREFGWACWAVWGSGIFVYGGSAPFCPPLVAPLVQPMCSLLISLLPQLKTWEGTEFSKTVNIVTLLTCPII